MLAMDSSASASGAPNPAHTKQYVFVDEYNRHKRLKVMRACDGCRKRKIRCDGALQNGPWPCGACVRLKLKCVPPTLDQDDDPINATTDGVSTQTNFQFQNTIFPSHLRTTASPSHASYTYTGSIKTPHSTTTAPTSAPSHQDDVVYYPTQHAFNHQLGSRMNNGYPDDESFASSAAPGPFQQPHAVPGLYRTETELSSSSGGDPEEVDAAVQELTGHMGDLRVEVTSMAPFIANHHRNREEAPLMDEAEVPLPASVMSDSTIRIPPEMMPHEERVVDYFDYFFKFIHPYVPVLNRNTLYEQWHTDRETISPLILEGIFACVSRYLEPNGIESKRWLALAARHEEHYKDIPRLSTVQAMVLLMKAREFVPKRGYFYRSWMAIKYMTTMATDLGLDEHFDQHNSASMISCKLSRSECLLRTRIWQTLFGLEIFIGGPQGRSDFAVEHETVDMSYPFPSADLDAFEYQTSRRYAVLAQAVKNIKITNNLFQSMKRKKKDWALDPAFQQHNEDLVAWLKALPSDMQIHYPDDGSPPWLGGDHFVAGVHAYHHLVVIMHHRPQLQAKLEKKDPTFKEHLDICAESAALMCRLQEALIRDFSLHGLLFMLRGINFTVYCVLSCAMLHLVAITSPDSSLNGQAREYFTRHMRVLERCTGSVSPDIVTQIDTLREAFSKDTSKPFELKDSLGMRSPTIHNQPTPPGLERHNSQPHMMNTSNAWPHPGDNTASSSSIPPASEYGHSFDTGSIPVSIPRHPSIPSNPYTTANYEVPANTSYAGHTYNQNVAPPQQQTPVWDPSGIFNQWNTAFGPPVQTPQSASPPTQQMMQQPAPTPMVQPQPQQRTSSQPNLYTPQHFTASGQAPHMLDPTVLPAVTPVMWQDAFTSAYVSGHGQKRYRDDVVESEAFNQYQPKRRG